MSYRQRDGRRHAGPEGKVVYRLKLYITGSSSASQRALENLQGICEEHLAGRYELEVVDLLERPGEAEAHDIALTPTLVKVEPSPARWLLGDLADRDRVLRALGVPASRHTRETLSQLELLLQRSRRERAGHDAGQALAEAASG